MQQKQSESHECNAGVTAEFVSGAAEGLLLTALAPHVLKSSHAQVCSDCNLLKLVCSL